MPTIRLETKIKADIETVFNISRNVDIHKASTSKTNEKAIGRKTEGLLELNDSVTWRAKHLGVYQNLTSKITEYNFPSFFVDEQLKGAFKSFRHEHQFKKTEYGTLMTDVFIYTSPLGLLGKFADFLFLKKYMTNFLIERNKFLKDYAESSITT